MQSCSLCDEYWRKRSVTSKFSLVPFPFICFVVVQSLSHVQLFATPRTATHQASPSFTISRRLLRLKSVESVNNHLTLCRPFFSCPRPFLSIGVFSTDSALPLRWPKYGSFSISPSSEYSGLISFRITLCLLYVSVFLSVLQCSLRNAESKSQPSSL